MAKKITGRVVPIYPRVTTRNQQWLTKAAKKFNKSQSEVVNLLITHATTLKGLPR